MPDDEKFIMLRNYDLWCNLEDREYDELNVAHQFIEAKKGDYIYFDSHHLNKLYFLKGGYIKIGFIDDEGNEIINVRARLLAFYYHLAIMDGYNGSATSYSIDNFLTHDDIAKLIGSARQTVTTLINQLEGEGLVKISRKKIEIPDVKKLQQLVMVT